MGKKINITNRNIYNLFSNKSISEGFFDNLENDLDDNKIPGLYNYTLTGGYKSSNRKKTAAELEARKLELWDNIANKQKANLENIYGMGGKSLLSSSVYKISPRLMYDEMEVTVFDNQTGQIHIEKIKAPAEIITLCEMIKDFAFNHPIYGPIIRRFDKPIVWTMNKGINTAASDGIRIAFNVVFAYNLIQKGKGDLALEKQAKGGKIDRDASLLTIGKYFLFVFVHEAYHELYEHNKQAQRKKETENGQNHDMANVAMDAEINRDIEELIPLLKGVTEIINGVMDPNFPIETWDMIFDEYYYNNKQMPTSEMPPSPIPMPSSNNNQNQNNSNSSSSSSSQSGSQSGLQQLLLNGDNQSDLQNGSQQQSGQSGLQNLNQQSGQESGQSGLSQLDGNQNGQQGSQSGLSGNSQQQSGQGSSGMSAPSNSGEDDEFNEAYNDELQKIADLMNGNGDNTSSEPRHLSDKEIDDIIQLAKDALGKGVSMKDVLKNAQKNKSNGQSNNMPKLDAESAQKLANELSKLEDLSGLTLQDAMNELDEMSMSKNEEAARAKALKDVKDMMDQMEKDAKENQQNNSDQSQPSQSAGSGSADMSPTVETSSKFGGSDMISKEELSKIAEEEGLPYTADELSANRDKLNDDYLKENRDALHNVSPALGRKIDDIRNKLKDVPVITNWKNKLKKFLKNQAEGEVEQIRSKRVMSLTWRQDRYMPYKDRVFTEDFGAADVFYLIDNSRSMWGAGFGENIFILIFAEILGIEKVCNIEKSALTYFADNGIHPENIRLWDKKTPKNKVLSMIGQDRDKTGGTNIGGNVIAVTKLKKPYYYNNGKKHTLLICFTDGEDSAQYEQIKKIPAKIKNDILFCLINRKDQILDNMSKLHKISGIKMANIIAICTNEFK